MFRFIHSSDLHLGKRFGNFSGDLPGRLREARHAVIATLARQAQEHGASAILLAGDTFDTETPAADVRRQALTEMAHHPAIRWVMLPGNHDSLQASELWDRLERESPSNVVLATRPEPIELAPNVLLLPAPCTTRRPGRDLSEWMAGASTAEGVMRIGLAHGAIRDFSEDTAASEVIAPNRAETAGLSYLALGDWHGALKVDPRTWYSGSPEQDRFKHDRPGEALLVSIAAGGAPPEVEALPTASFAWRTFDLHLLADDDPVHALAGLLPDVRDRRQTLAQVVVTGRSNLASRIDLQRAVEEAAPDFAWLELDDDGLATDCEVDDLDAIDRGGALREAADALLARSQDDGLSAAERDVASAALARLYAYAQAVPS
ncbi:MAG TPA: metallophosphoesterase [Novosphingobium sp.]